MIHDFDSTDCDAYREVMEDVAAGRVSNAQITQLVLSERERLFRQEFRRDGARLFLENPVEASGGFFPSVFHNGGCI